MALPCVNGSYLPKQENEFIHTVLQELDVFQQKNEEKSVLLFPPVPNRFRFLIHQTCLSYPDFSTFSVGEGCARRVVVCHSDLRLPEENHGAQYSSYERASSRYQETEEKGSRRSLESRANNSRRARRPDKAIYVPRTMRHNADLEHPNLMESYEESDSPKTPFIANPEPKGNSADQSLANQEFVVLSRSGPPPWPSEWDQTVSFLMSFSLDDQADENCANSAVLSSDATLQETDDSFLSEIKAKLIDGDVTVLNTSSDFSAYANVCLDPEEFGHIIEIYDFPANFKTEDINEAFADYSGGGMKIKWVDNTHALGIFSSQSAATQALSIDSTVLKTRALLQGSEKSKMKATRRAEFMQPVKERPRTDTAVAHRMVSRALGLKGGQKGKQLQPNKTTRTTPRHHHM